jgi:hypothetical protein
MAGTSPAMTARTSSPKILFIIFVDAIFTSLFERPFTKVFDVTGANPRFSCVYRACNAD